MNEGNINSVAEKQILPVPKLSTEHFTGDAPLPQTLSILQQEYLKTILDQDKEYLPPTPVIRLRAGDSLYPILTLKSFSLWQGKQKSKKTVVLALMAAAYIRDTQENENTQFEGEGEGVVLWFDTEQGESYAARTMKLILKLAGIEKSNRLKFSDLREYGPTDRLKLIQAGIESIPNVRLVIIDGLVDLMNDFMEAEEAHRVLTTLLTYCSTYNIHIAGVLHQNKADKNARAHIGSIGSQKCETEVSTDVDTEDRARSIVSCVNCRGLPFEDFAIRWDKGALPCIDQDYMQQVGKKKTPGAKLYETGKRVVEAVFKPLAVISYTEAVGLIMQTEPCSKSTAENRIKDYQGWGFIVKGPDGNYRKNMNHVAEN